MYLEGGESRGMYRSAAFQKNYIIPPTGGARKREYEFALSCPSNGRIIYLIEVRDRGELRSNGISPWAHCNGEFTPVNPFCMNAVKTFRDVR